MKKIITFISITILIVNIFYISVFADSVELSSVADSTLLTFLDVNFGDSPLAGVGYGGGFARFTDRPNLGGYHKYLIKFDINKLPRGTIINKAQLIMFNLNALGCQYCVRPMLADVSPIMIPWTENEVSLGNFPNNYGSYGNKFVNTWVLNSGWYSWDIKGLVQSWIQGTMTNNGLIVTDGTESVTMKYTSYTEFASREYDETLKRPLLYIDYTVPDATPESFNFDDQIGVPTNSSIESDQITVSGINVPTYISIVNGKYSINGGIYTSFRGSVSNGNTVKVRQISSSRHYTKTDATLTIGGISDPFSVTTILNTSIKVFVMPKTITPGKKTTVYGQLKDSRGKPVAGKIVKVKANGKVIKSIRTNAGGKFSFKHKPKKTTKYQAVYNGDTSFLISNSKAVKVTVKKAKKKKR